MIETFVMKELKHGKRGLSKESTKLTDLQQKFSE